VLERACSRSNRSLSFLLLFCNHSIALLIDAFASCDSTTQSVQKARPPSSAFLHRLHAQPPCKHAATTHQRRGQFRGKRFFFLSYLSEHRGRLPSAVIAPPERVVCRRQHHHRRARVFTHVTTPAGW
jgi:hypothetical protein